MAIHKCTYVCYYMYNILRVYRTWEELYISTYYMYTLVSVYKRFEFKRRRYLHNILCIRIITIYSIYHNGYNCNVASGRVFR